MTDALSRLLATRDWLMADGATGSNLFAMGLAESDLPDLWNATHPAQVTALYSAAVQAGSDIFLTNSFGCNASRLRPHGAEDRAASLARISAELARNVADRAQRAIVVAGAIGPTGEIFAPMGTMTHASAVAIFHEQAEALKQGGADVLWLETLSCAQEYTAAAEAFALTDMPWCGTMSFDTSGQTMMGVTAAALVDLVESLPNPPLAFGANCGTGPSDLLRTILGFAAQGTERPLIAKASAGLPVTRDGRAHYAATPDLMAEYAVLARDSGARIIGGCCGTTPQHLERMRRALDSRPRGARPTLDQITVRLGALSPVQAAEDVATLPL